MNMRLKPVKNAIHSKTPRAFALTTALLITLLLAPLTVLAIDAKTAGANPTPLFSSDAPISIQIEAPLKQLFETKNKSLHVQGFLIYQGLRIPTQIRVRGFYSLEECDFPKLALTLDKDAIRGTVFAQNQKLDLGTHCFADKHDYGMAHPFREVMTYNWLKLADLVGFSARSAKINYIETTTGEASAQFEGFLLENMKGLLKRTGAVEIKMTFQKGKDDVDNDRVKYLYDGKDESNFGALNYTRFSLFELLIGNGDVYVEGLHNVRLIEGNDKEWSLVPLDFNLSQVVMGYTNSPESLQDGMQRLLSHKTDRQTLVQVMGEFESQRDNFYQSLRTLGEDDPDGVKITTETLDMFFKALSVVKPELEKEIKTEAQTQP